MSSDEQKNLINFNDKAGFIVGFFAAAIALYPLKEQLDLIRIDILIRSVSLTSIFIIGLGILFFAMWLYALNYIRYDFPSLLTIRWLHYIEIAAKAFYFISIFVYPFLILILFIVASIIKHLPEIPFGINQLIFTAGILMGVVLAFKFQIEEFKKKEDFLLRKIRERELELSAKAREFRSLDNYKYALLETYNSVVKGIEASLIRLHGSGVERIPQSELIRLALMRKVISEKEYEFIQRLRSIRNQVAHGEFESPISRREVDVLLARAKILTTRLQRENTSKSNY